MVPFIVQEGGSLQIEIDVEGSNRCESWGFSRHKIYEHLSQRHMLIQSSAVVLSWEIC